MEMDNTSDWNIDKNIFISEYSMRKITVLYIFLLDLLSPAEEISYHYFPYFLLSFAQTENQNRRLSQIDILVLFEAWILGILLLIMFHVSVTGASST